MVVKTLWYWNKDRHIKERNRIVSQEINPYIYNQLIFKKNAKSMGKEYSFQQIIVGKWIFTYKKK